MNIFKNIFGARRSSSTSDIPLDILQVMHVFTTASLAFAPPVNHNANDTRFLRTLVFLFGALDALLQRHNMKDESVIYAAHAYLRQEFPDMPDNDIEGAIGFLCDASADPEWTPVMRKGGQAMLDWASGDAVAPARLVEIILLRTN